jgi:glutamine synthetase
MNKAAGTLPPAAAARGAKASLPVAAKAEARAFREANPDIRFVDALLVDICGKLRGKRFPIRELDKLFASGMQIPQTIYLLDVTGDQHDPCGRGYSDGDPDGTAMPVPGTLVRVPWTSEPQAQMLMSLFERPGVPALVEPRAVLARVLKRLSELKLKAVVAFELEFYLIDTLRGEGGAPLPAISPFDGRRAASREAYGILELDRFSDFISACDKAAEIQGIPASAASKELAPGQFEINLQHTDDPLKAADQAAMLRHLVTGVARSKGVEATFMAKPFLGSAGSGMHLHINLAHESGRNVFASGGAGESPLLRHAIGGMQATLHEALAIFAPDLNAFRRYMPMSFAPVNRRWGHNNRSVAFRVPAGPDEARRVEVRPPAACANPYLALAASLAGMHHGIADEIDPGAPAVGNVGNDIDQTLPSELSRALDELARAPVIRSYLGADYIDIYVALKRAEHRKFMGVISPTEYAWYL